MYIHALTMADWQFSSNHTNGSLTHIDHNGNSQFDDVPYISIGLGIGTDDLRADVIAYHRAMIPK